MQHLPPRDQGNKDRTQSPAERREQQLLELSVTQIPEVSSWGERLLPVLFAAIETCWLDAILIGLASINLFQTRTPLLPLWAPFLLLVGSGWLSLRLERNAASKAPSSIRDIDTTTSHPGSSLFNTLLVVIIVFLIWLRLYAPTNFLLDPRWLLSLLNDILLLDLRAFQVFLIVALSLYLCWRGIRLSRRNIEPSHVYSALCLGLGIILAVILVRAGQESSGIIFHDEETLLFLASIFLFLSLAAHALARVAFIRHSHPMGLQGSTAIQERSMLFIIGIIGLFLLLIALIVGSIASPSFLEDAQRALVPLGQAYDWLVGIIAYIMVFLATPLFWLISWLGTFLHPLPPKIKIPKVKGSTGKPATVAPESIIVLASLLKFILPVLFVVFAVMLVRLALRRRRVRIVPRHLEREVHESLWSWALFLTQLRLFLETLFGRFFRRRAPDTATQTVLAKIEGEPAARSIREIYRTLLQKAASRGYPRKKEETPYEFEQRLDEKAPEAEPQLAEITAAYAATRYGEIVPDEANVAHIRAIWSELDQKWRET